MPKKRWTPWLIGAAVLILATGCVVWYTADTKAEPAGKAADFDVNNAPFFLAKQGMPTDKVRLTDGEYYPEGASGNDAHMRLANGQSPTIADMNGDGHDDVVAILEWTGGEQGGWRGLYIWQWTKNGIVPVKWLGSWQWNCVSQADQPALEKPAAVDAKPGGITVSRGNSNYCGSQAPEKTESSGANTSIWLRDGYPVRGYGGWEGAPEACSRGAKQSKSELVELTDAEPLVAPEKAAPEVRAPEGEAAKSVAVWKPELDDARAIEARHGFVPATIDTGMQDMSFCGWVPAKTVR